MAPSSRNRMSKLQVQPATKPFRVTKSAKLNVQPQACKQKLQAIEEVISPKEQPQQNKQVNKKRRRDALDSDCENEEGAKPPQKALRKARSITSSTELRNMDHIDEPTPQLQTPPPSSRENESLPIALDELCSLHKSFTQALAIHYAHNGTRNAVPLANLIPAITRLWKRRNITENDIQQMLAIWEIDIRETISEQGIQHKKGPFRLLITGIGAGSQTKLEYAWEEQQTFIESELHLKFDGLVRRLHNLVTGHAESFVFGPLCHYPLLKCQIGAQTLARKEKISLIRDEILHKPTQAKSGTASQSLDLSKLDISDPSDPKAGSRETVLKSRTLSLFDRLRAKQLANSASTSIPTSGELLRRRALHRMPDIIDVLRLKQARKLSSQFRSDIHGSPSKTFATMMKVSFSLDALIQEIRDSGKTNIAPDEIKECILILGRELPDTWCNVYTTGDLKCVTLQGEGWRKEEVKEWCDREISRIGSK